MYKGVMQHLGLRTGDGPEMMVDEGKIFRKSEEMVECMSRTYEEKLKKVEKRIGKPEGDHLKILWRMTRKKINKFTFTKVSLKEIEKKIDKITSKPSSSTCGISYEVLKKMKEEVKTNNNNKYGTRALSRAI
jgi:glutathionylspermidine synthase